MNLDEYIQKMEAGDLDRDSIQKFSQQASLSRILRLYSSYVEAKKSYLCGEQSLSWILSSLKKALELAGFYQASDLLKTDINASFVSFWEEFEKCKSCGEIAENVAGKINLNETYSDSYA